jgi:hypothetical protein
LPRGFSNRELRDCVAPLLGKAPAEFTAGQMTYQLRRLRLRGLIRRIPKTHRYEVTEHGIRTATFFTSGVSRVLRPLAAAQCNRSFSDAPMRRILREVYDAMPQLNHAA